MTVPLPAPVAAYFRAANAHDSDAVGDFPGSPVRIDFAFTLGAHTIDALEITA